MEARARARPRRGVTLAEQLAASSNLRDLLKLRDGNGDGDGQGERAARRRRTLLDVIRDADGDRAPAAASARRGVRPATGRTAAAEPAPPLTSSSPARTTSASPISRTCATAKPQPE